MQTQTRAWVELCRKRAAFSNSLSAQRISLSPSALLQLIPELHLAPRSGGFFFSVKEDNIDLSDSEGQKVHKGHSLTASFDMNPCVVPWAVQSFCLEQLCYLERQNKVRGEEISKPKF